MTPLSRSVAAPLVALLLAACNSPSTKNEPGITPGQPSVDGNGVVTNPGDPIAADPNGGGGATPGKPITAAPAGSVNAFTGGLGANSFPSGPSLSPTSGYTRYIGRVTTSAPGGVRLSWPGTALQVRVTGASRVTATIRPTEYVQNNVIGVLVDGAQTGTFNISDNTSTYNIVVPTGDHLVTLVKRTEAGNGELLISNLATDGQFEKVASGTGRLIEFVGDNATAGYSSGGPLGVTTCSQPVNSVADPAMQNAANTYGVLAAQNFGADWSILAFSGRGLVQNFDGSRSMTLPALYPRLNPEDVGSVVQQSPNAGAVVINLGTNDINYWMQNNNNIGPDIAGFTSAYVALLTQVHTTNPNAALIAAIGPTLGNYQCITGSSAADHACSAGGTLPALSTWRSAVQAAISQYQASNAGVKVSFVEFAPSSSPNDLSACYMPSATGHAAMAQALIPAIASATGWSQGVAAAQPAVASAGSGPKALTGTFAAWPDPLAGAAAAAQLITNKQYPQCHYCSPQPYNAAFVGTAACPTLLGTRDACQSYCHVPDGFTEVHASNPPTSGNHYSTPAVNGQEFTQAVPRGKWIHSLEHGAIVLSYNCPNGCDADLAIMRQAYQQNDNNGAWIIFTPDPLLPGERFAALSWTYTLRFDKPSLATLNCFIKQHAFNGRECLPKTQAGCSPLLDKPMGSEEG